MGCSATICDLAYYEENCKPTYFMMAELNKSIRNLSLGGVMAIRQVGGRKVSGEIRDETNFRDLKTGEYSQERDIFLTKN